MYEIYFINAKKRTDGFLAEIEVEKGLVPFGFKKDNIYLLYITNNIYFLFKYICGIFIRKSKQKSKSENVSKEVVKVSKGNIWDTVMFYWNHPFHATRISFKVGLPSLLIGLISLIIGIL